MRNSVIRNFAAQSEDSAKNGTGSPVGITYSRPLKPSNLKILQS